MIRRKKITALRPHHAPRRRSKRRKGVAMVEFAIVANILFVLIFTCMEFARLNMVRNLSQDAAYFAARHVIVPGATKEEAIAEADRIMGALLTNGYTIDVGDVDVDSQNIVVTVSVDLGAVALFAPLFLPDNDLVVTARMRSERYDGFYEQQNDQSP